MKIILVGTAFPMRGGIAHYMALLYKKLTEMGHTVEIVSFKRQYPAFLFPGKTQQDTSQQIIELPSLPLIDSINPLSWIRTFLYIKKQAPDLVVYKYWMPFFAPAYGTIVLLTRLFTRTKSLYISDNIIPHEQIPVIDWLLTRWGLWKVDYFIVQSQTVKNDLLKYKPRAAFRQVPHPVFEIFTANYASTEARTRLHLGADEKVLLFFGYIRAYKGLGYLIDALAEVRRQLPVRLLVAGEFYEEEEKYRQQIHTLHLEEAILLKADYIPNEEVGLYFAAADVVVLPYISATQSGIIQIAYNFDKPVITTNVGGLPEVIDAGRTGFTVPARDSHALANAILHFFQIRDQVDFQECIRLHKRNYSWENLAKAITGFITK
ncbi:MAG TPA: glycosyltransferase [bacterium]|nr:glycosyltransferase [bacterium]HQG46538.1 glycosyltransferase [bacterium]HQI47654.1 glycosyltransferase [bacterium]HQJ63260.1 glycosyltransferase [bacterium]